MMDLNCPDRASWDPFCQRVQRELVEHLGLENAVISVDRHHGKNTNVDVNLWRHSDDKPAANIDSHQPAGQQIQLTMDQLTRQVESIVDVLLEDCDVCFGDITFHVKRRLLEKIEFKYSKRPQESTACFF
jgi:hypothetical protein